MWPAKCGPADFTDPCSSYARRLGRHASPCFAARWRALYSSPTVNSSGEGAIRFDDQVAVIVGAGPGLGAVLGRRFAAAGADVALVARSPESLQASEAAARVVGGNVLTVAADITSPTDAQRMADEIVARFQRVDVLVNAAFGGAPKRNLLDMDTDALEQWRRTVEVGGYGTLLACRYLVPHMVERGHGSIVNVTSMSSRIGFAGRSDYSVGKAQAHKIAHALADELGPQGIRVNCVAPGHIWSEQLEGFYRGAGRAARRRVRDRARGVHRPDGIAPDRHQRRGRKRGAVPRFRTCVRDHRRGPRRERRPPLHAMRLRP